MVLLNFFHSFFGESTLLILSFISFKLKFEFLGWYFLKLSIYCLAVLVNTHQLVVSTAFHFHFLTWKWKSWLSLVSFAVYLLVFLGVFLLHKWRSILCPFIFTLFAYFTRDCCKSFPVWVYPFPFHLILNVKNIDLGCIWEPHWNWSQLDLRFKLFSSPILIPRTKTRSWNLGSQTPSYIIHQELLHSPHNKINCGQIDRVSVIFIHSWRTWFFYLSLLICFESLPFPLVYFPQSLGWQSIGED